MNHEPRAPDSSLRKPGHLLPRPLEDGGIIRVVSVGSPAAPEAVARGVSLLEARGFRVELDPDRLRSAHPYLAAPDDERLEELERAFADPRVGAIICARGGYGTLRLIDRLDTAHLAGCRKAFCGFSDITALHLVLNQHGLVTFHGPVVTTLATAVDPQGLVGQLVDWWQGKVTGSRRFTGRPAVSGLGRGTLIGGNLSLLAACLPTRLVTLPDPFILLIEDVNEPLYRLDRMITQLRLSGLLKSAAGFALGSFARCGEGEGGPFEPARVVVDCLRPLGVPIITDLPVGHLETDGVMPLGLDAVIDGDEGELTVFLPEPDGDAKPNP